MDSKEILSRCDHTLLKQEATWAQILHRNRLPQRLRHHGGQGF